MRESVHTSDRDSGWEERVTSGQGCSRQGAEGIQQIPGNRSPAVTSAQGCKQQRFCRAAQKGDLVPGGAWKEPRGSFVGGKDKWR